MPDERTRTRSREAFVRAATGCSEPHVERASRDAGLRSYWRVHGSGPSRIVMDSPPDLEDVRPWLAIRELLAGGGVRVPQVIARDVAAGFVLLEDLGAETCLQVVDRDNADHWYEAAMTQLLRLQSIQPPMAFPEYDEALLMRELKLFETWFLGGHLGLELSHADGERLQRSFGTLIDAALAQPQVLVHRDFMLRNLMPVDDGPAVLDFQDAVRGPIAYDPICLFKDAFVNWPETRVDGWLDRFHARAMDAGLPVPSRVCFRRDADLIGVQRHLKVLGIFARLNYRDAKPDYLLDAPRFIAYLDEVLPHYPELSSLAELMHETIRPALIRIGTLSE